MAPRTNWLRPELPSAAAGPTAAIPRHTITCRCGITITPTPGPRAVHDYRLTPVDGLQSYRHSTTVRRLAAPDRLDRLQRPLPYADTNSDNDPTPLHPHASRPIRRHALGHRR